MDSGRNKSCDPFVQLHVGGHEPIQTSVRSQTLEPMWNEELVVPIRWPLLSERATIVVKDQDFTGSEEIATFQLSIGDTARGLTKIPRWYQLYKYVGRNEKKRKKSKTAVEWVS